MSDQKKHIDSIKNLLDSNDGKVDIRNFGEILQHLIKMTMFEDQKNASIMLDEIAQKFKAIKYTSVEKTLVHNSRQIMSTEIVKQINSINQSTTEAAGKILETTEKINELNKNNSENSELQKKLEDLTNEITVACSIQDLNGQRIQEIYKKIDLLDLKIKHLTDFYNILVEEAIVKAKDPAQKDALLNGPANHSGNPSQDEIDNLFDNS